MNELLGMLRDAVGIKPLVPVLLIVLLGMAFLAVRRYPTHELLYDRWFLVCALAIIFAGLAYAILNSGLAERTPSGRVGVYLAQLKNDPDRSAHLRLFERIQMDMEFKARSSGIQVEVRDLKQEVDDQQADVLTALSGSLNAAVIIWGTITDGTMFYPRVWSERLDRNRSNQEINTKDAQQMSMLSEQIWQHVSNFAKAQVEKRYLSLQDVETDIRALRTEVAELRSTRSVIGAAAGPAATPLATHSTAILVGVGYYEGAASLVGPKNDVAALEQVLRNRGTRWSTTTLVDRNASSASLRAAIDAAISTIGADEVLLLYFSGHVSQDRISSSGATQETIFFFSNIKDMLPLSQLVRDVLKRHRKSIFIVDSGFRLEELSAGELNGAALMTSDVSGKGVALERDFNGTHYGAFTAALTKVLAESPPGVPLRAPELFGAIDAILKGWGVRGPYGPTAGIIFGDDPPAL